MATLFGGNKGSDIAKQQLEAQQRRSLADLAKQQGEIDQAAASPAGGTRKQGRGLLTFLSGAGQDTFG
ncbi:hypothetical protein EN817_17615 [Mesorhizobium sp. M3A.F.Ca.ET.174.01.1.1]|uniref:hypothetical protein n=1 Tax=unclassified Mesorhizobium TaxID=325217 RepID=UPI001093D866|nr:MULTISPECIES: hypothetical protein [unclassified Mesorhizobium]TGS86720.1 hypothetical protein EN818_15470 [Mesorhizobium sp. M3A.F.Ca.ET.175.01.1.1]TGT25168.1 hypothetical protein EN817_17615 [Mesorhizobium sp. M3A.F.Ca.ET.174.01.1.1]